MSETRKVRLVPDQTPTAPLIEQFQSAVRNNAADARTLAERMLRGSELALEAARRDAAEAEVASEELSERILALEAELEQAQTEPARVRGLLAGERRSRRLAEQEAYAERARREELQQELAAAERETDLEPDDRAEADQRQRELEAEVASLRRRSDELTHLVGSARRARERAERRVAELTAELAAAPGPGRGLTAPDLSVAAGLAKEFDLAARPVISGPQEFFDAAPVPSPGLALERELVRARVTAFSARREIEARLRAETRAEELERRLSEQITRSSRAFDAIEALRLRLRAIGDLPAGPLVAPEPEPEPPAPGLVSAPEPGFEAPVAVEPERFTAALNRLREAAPVDPAGGTSVTPATLPDTEPVAPAPAPAVAWLPRVFRRLVDEDPAAAGQLVLELLPAQRTVHPEPIAYDIELAGQTCVQLTIAGGELRLELGQRRPRDEVRFVITGDAAGLARLLATGRIRRRLRRGLPTVSGDRRGLEAIDSLLRAPLSLRQLHDADVRLEPALALEVVARMIDPGWTSGSRFAIGYRSPAGTPLAFLEIRDGDSPQVSDTVAPGLVVGMIACPPDSLLARLDGAEFRPGEFDGESAQLAKLISWVKRAQSG